MSQDFSLSDYFKKQYLNGYKLTETKVTESVLRGQLAGDSASDMADLLRRYGVKQILNQPNDSVTYLQLTDKSKGKMVVSMLKKMFGIEAQIDNHMYSPSPAVKFDNDQIVESKLTENKLTESRIDQSKVFDQSEVEEIVGEIREITGILEDKYRANVEYSEYRFSDGTGGFSFKWAHSRNWGGRFGLSLREDGNHKLEAISWYDKSKYGSEDIKSGNTNVQNIETWRDLDNSMLISIWAQLQTLVKKNEVEAEKALSREAKAQSDYYGAKADTGRIGYGLSSQPRMRNENINDPILMKMRAQQDQYDRELEKSIEPKVDFDEILDLRDEKGDLERRIKNLYREMENDPDVEGEGGAVADQYGDELNKLETRLYKIMKQINQYDMNESLTESLNPEVSKALDRFIKAMAKRYDYSEKDAVFAIQAALKQRDFRDEEKSSKFKKSGEEAGFDMRGLKESTEKSWDAIDVSRKAEKELGNKEWNERTTKKLDMLKAFNKSGKFKKDWSEEKLQGWVDKNYSWEKLSQQFKLNESKGKLNELKKKIYNSLKK